MINLFEAILKIKTKEELENFFIDLCTPQELKEFKERWQIAQLLFENTKSYRKIASETGISVTTIARINRFLNYEKNNGYRSVLENQDKY